MNDITLVVTVSPFENAIPSDQLDSWRENMARAAIHNLQENGSLEPTLLGLGDVPKHMSGGPGRTGPAMVVVPLGDYMGSDHDKDRLEEALPKFLRDIHCHYYLVVMDAHMRTVEIETDREEGASEAVLVLAVQKGQPSGQVVLYPYERDKDGKVLRVLPAIPHNTDNLMAGRFTNLFDYQAHAPVAEA